MLPNQKHLRGVHNGFCLIAAEYEQGKKDGEDAATDDHRAGQICQHGERYSEAEEIGPVLFNVRESPM